MGTNNLSNQGSRVQYATYSVVRSTECLHKQPTSKSQLTRVTSDQIKNGRSQAYKHLIR
jgi:hypothetical protein